ncbi:MAG TPA: hypothetical protein VFP26_02900 [Gemmatimonadaceae bacterium]|jgi:hypothetical protein|nr:hypothetical protein [Gemmatimonadaceae bacterium]
MAYKEFRDAAGISWRVWATYPTVGKIYTSGFEKGWLTFESQLGRRRLAPIPGRWDTMEEDKLRLLLKAAEPPRSKGRDATTESADL